MNIQGLIAAVAVALALGFGTGYYTKAKFATADQVAQERKDTRQSTQNVVKAVEQSTKLDLTVAQDGEAIDKIQQAVAARAAKYHLKPERKNDPIPQHSQPQPAGEPVAQVDCPRGGLLLDVGTVRLLNQAASEGADLGAAGSGNGQEPAAAQPPR